MKFEINEYIKTNLSPNAYIVLYGILTNNKDLKKHLNTVVFDIREELIELQSKGYIKLLGDDLSYEIRKKGLDLKGASIGTPKERANRLLIPFRELFPVGTNNGGYRYRGDKQGCLEKLEKFIKDNPEWTDEQILEATKRYVDRFKPTYQGMRQAHYFINKDKISDLSGELEGLIETPKIEKKKSLNKMI